MTPTLQGRWQTRMLLLTVIGIPVTAFFGLLYRDIKAVFFILGMVGLFGLVWDIAYQMMLKYRWDHDWPAVMQLGAGIWEALFLWSLLRFTPVASMLGIQLGVSGLTMDKFLLHYGSIWVLAFLSSQSLMRIFFPKWRYFGGEWLR